jgi:hypothetical protein
MEWPKARNAQVNIALITRIQIVVNLVVLVERDYPPEATARALYFWNDRVVLKVFVVKSKVLLHKSQVFALSPVLPILMLS